MFAAIDLAMPGPDNRDVAAKSRTHEVADPQRLDGDFAPIRLDQRAGAIARRLDDHLAGARVRRQFEIPAGIGPGEGEGLAHLTRATGRDRYDGVVAVHSRSERCARGEE